MRFSDADLSAGQWRIEIENVTRGKRPLGRGLSAVDQQDTLEAGRDAEASGHVGCGAAVGNVEHGDTRVAAGRKVALERGEEPDFDAHGLSGRWSSDRLRAGRLEVVELEAVTVGLAPDHRHGVDL